MKCTSIMLLAALLVATSASAQGTPDRSMADEDLHTIVRNAGERRTSSTAARSPAHPAAALSSGGRFLFVSRGMPQAELLAALDAAAADPELTLVLRGLLPGESLNDAMRALARLIGRRDPPPGIVIDPTLYRRHQVKAVPTLLDPASGSRREGAINANDLAQALPPGFAATTWEIAEPDLADVLQARAAALDVPARARAAVARFWRQVPALTLPPATTSRTRRFTPAVRTSSALRDDQGRLLLRAGAVLNPLATLPLTARILVLDARDPAEIAWAKTQRAVGRATIHLAVNPDREGGWAAWQALQDQLESPVFLLDAQLQGRLGVQVTPSLIEAQGAELVVTEIALSSTHGDQAMTSLPCRRPHGRKSWAWAAPLAWLLAGAALLLLATVAAPPRLVGEPPLFWIGQARPLPSPLSPSHALGHGHAALPAAGESQP